MRVTNLMMTNNALFNLQKQEQRLNRLDQQYTTQKKISTPSQDPIIATRALKLNTTYSEVTQYVTKNIPDAVAWMSMTQSALDNTSSILTSIYEKCVQGNTDGLEDVDRKAIATSLSEYRDQIYQEGTSSYSGRFLFTGFKTDTNLVFTEPVSDEYTITENFTPDDLSSISSVIYKVEDTATAATTVGKVPVKVEFDRIRLAYDKLDVGVEPSITVTGGTMTPSNPPSTGLQSTYPTYELFLKDYEDMGIGANDVIYIADKGELILGENAKQALKASDGFSIEYRKTGFDMNDLRPEHYFTCTRVRDKNLDTEKTFEYIAQEQDIKYLVNYNQQMTVNVQAKDCYTHNMGRDVDELVDIVNDAIAAQDKMDALENKMKAEVEGSAAYDTFKGLYENAKVEFELKSKIMQQAFADNEVAFQQRATEFSDQATDVGAREQRVELIRTRLENQQADVEELQSENIDVDLSEIIVRYTSALDVYQAALSATAKSITQTLLDYL